MKPPHVSVSWAPFSPWLYQHPLPLLRRWGHRCAAAGGQGVVPHSEQVPAVGEVVLTCSAMIAVADLLATAEVATELTLDRTLLAS